VTVARELTLPVAGPAELAVQIATLSIGFCCGGMPSRRYRRTRASPDPRQARLQPIRSRLADHLDGLRARPVLVRRRPVGAAVEVQDEQWLASAVGREPERGGPGL